LGERPIDVYQNTVQFNQPLLWLHTASDLCVPTESDADNEIILDEAIAQYWKDNLRDILDATSHLVNIQFQDDIGFVAWLAAHQFGSSDISLFSDLTQIARFNVATPWYSFTERCSSVHEFAWLFGICYRRLLLHSAFTGRDGCIKSAYCRPSVIGGGCFFVSSCD
jgi:hypothetical protein